MLGLWLALSSLLFVVSDRESVCWVWLADSTLPGAGRGTFAGKDLEKGEVIALTRGARASDAVILGSQLSHYSFVADGTETEHQSRAMLGVSPLINAASPRYANIEYAQTLLQNDTGEIIGRVDNIVALRAIHAGEELFYALEKRALTAFGFHFVDVGEDEEDRIRELSEMSDATCLTDIVMDTESDYVQANHPFDMGQSFTSPVAILSDELIDQDDLLSGCSFGPHTLSNVLALPLAVSGKFVDSTDPNLVYTLEALDADGNALKQNLWEIAGSPFTQIAIRFTAVRYISLGEKLSVDRSLARTQDSNFWPAHWKTSLTNARLEAAQSGDIRAQYQHAQSLLQGAPGSGRAPDKVKAFDWLKKAAKGGHPWANFMVAEAYTHGRGVSKDRKASTWWYEQAAEGEVCEASIALGLKYQNGYGVQQNLDQSAYWLHRAALSNCSALHSNGQAMYLLAWALETGRGLPMDRDEGLRWLRLSADAGEAVAQSYLASKMSTGSGVDQDLEAAELLFEKSAKQGEITAQLSLGMKYAQGEHTDPKKAVYWIKRAAKQKDRDALLILGSFYQQGFGVEADLDQARKYYQKSAELGSAQAEQAIQAIGSSSTETTTPDADL